MLNILVIGFLTWSVISLIIVWFKAADDVILNFDLNKWHIIVLPITLMCILAYICGIICLLICMLISHIVFKPIEYYYRNT